MNKIIAAGLAAAVIGMGGCASRYADVPAPTRFENSEQKKLQAAAHWRNIAEHVASQIARDTTNRLQGRMIHVPQPSGEQRFVSGFRELLITALVNQGVAVSTQANNALTVDVNYSIYKFSPERVRNTQYYGEATMLAAGLWAIGGIAAANISSTPGVDVGAKLLAAAAAIDGFNWLKNEEMGQGKYASGAIPRSEIILTTSVTDGSRIVSRASNIYYTVDEDKALYWDTQTGGHLLKVESRGDK